MAIRIGTIDPMLASDEWNRQKSLAFLVLTGDAHII
jgi:hypothetical protein